MTVDAIADRLARVRQRFVSSLSIKQKLGTNK